MDAFPVLRSVYRKITIFFHNIVYSDKLFREEEIIEIHSEVDVIDDFKLIFKKKTLHSTTRVCVDFYNDLSGSLGFFFYIAFSPGNIITPFQQ